MPGCCLDEIRKKFGNVEEGIGIEDKEIREVIELSIELANQTIDFCKLKEKFGIPSDRSMKLRIHDVVGEVGFVIVGCNVRPLIGIEKVTTTVELSKDVFWAIVSKKLSVYDAWLYDLVKIRGEYSLRDAQILIPMFELISDIIFGGGETG